MKVVQFRFGLLGKRWGTEYKSSALALITASVRHEGYWRLSVGKEDTQGPLIGRTLPLGSEAQVRALVRPLLLHDHPQR